MFAATHRYLSLFESNPGFSSRDSLSGLFIPPLIRFLLGFSWVRHRVHKKLHIKLPGTYEYVIARTKCFDQQFEKALQAKVPQIVILGAGYDTRAVRYQNETVTTTVFELDTGILQARKRKIFKKNEVSIPDNLIFCPITFGKDSVARVLEASSFLSEQETLFLWEGVTYYLTESSVIEILEFIKNNAGPGSELVFDYFYQSFVDGDDAYYGAQGLHASAAKTREPYLFGIEEGKLVEFLSKAGFEVVCQQTPTVLEKSYLYSKERLLGKVYGFAEIARARANL